jgi:glycerophosphoryl diester phosphodiesterase
MLQSFDARNVRAALEIRVDLPTAFLAEDEAGVRLGVEQGWRVHLDHRLLDDRMAGLLSAAGRPFGVWTVNTEAEVQRVLDLGVSAIISDYPEMVLRVADREGFDCL